MDPLSLLLALVGLIVYPGGLYVAAVAVLATRLGGSGPGRGRWTAATTAGAACAVIGAALAPLPGSPLETLPSGSGVAPSLAAYMLFMAAAVGLGTVTRWSGSRMVLVVVAVPLLAIAASTSTLALPTMVAVPGTAVSVARLFAGIGLLIAAPLLVVGEAGGLQLPRAVIVAALAVPGLSLFATATLGGHPAWLVSAAVFGGAVVHGVVAQRLPCSRPALRWGISVATLLVATVATVAAVRAGG